MKKIILTIIVLFTLLSCGKEKLPEDFVRDTLYDQIELQGISEYMAKALERESRLTVTASDMGSESFAFLSYAIPVMREHKALRIRLWFLSGLEDSEIQAFLKHP